MSSADTRLQAADAKRLLEVAGESISHGLEVGVALPVDLSECSEILRSLRASFVTLNRLGKLRGCTGTLEAHQPLVHDVARNAYRSAFEDPRFAPLERGELDDLEIHLSILSPMRRIHAESEEVLLAQLQPKIDGLVLRDPELGCSGTFLPAVWESLPDPRRFLAELKLKAGLPRSHWSSTLEVYRYTVEDIGS